VFFNRWDASQPWDFTLGLLGFNISKINPVIHDCGKITLLEKEKLRYYCG
jgi:hypothetical protein